MSAVHTCLICYRYNPGKLAAAFGLGFNVGCVHLCKTTQNCTLRHVKLHLFSFVQFQRKISLLMRARGLSTRAVGNALAVSNATVAGWCKGALPRPAVAKQLADYFGVSVEDLLDDRRDLPAAAEPASQVSFATAAPSPTPAPGVAQENISGVTEVQEAAPRRQISVPRDFPLTGGMREALPTDFPPRPRPRQEDPAVTTQLLATLKSLQEQLTTQGQLLTAQSQQIADLTAYIKSQGLQPPDPKGKR